MTKEKIIIKIGTNVIFNSKKHKVNEKFISILAKDVKRLTNKGYEIIIVSSGAVGCGKKIISGKNGTGLKQAQSSVGQVILMKKYSETFLKYGLNISQFLITLDNLNSKTKMHNIQETYNHLKGKAIPIVNENDTISTEELTFGDNDILASQLLLHLNFDKLIILTKLGALLKNKKPVLKSKDFSAENYDRLNLPNEGFGGLKSKLEAARFVDNSKKECIIAKAGDSIEDILNGKVEVTRFN